MKFRLMPLAVAGALLALSLSVNAGSGVPGLYQASYSGSTTTTGDPEVGGDVVSGALFASVNNVSSGKLTYTEGGKTYELGNNTTYAYKGVMLMSAGVTNFFMKNFDDYGRVLVYDLTTYVTNVVLESSKYDDEKLGTFVPTNTTWYGIELRVGNGSGGIGPQKVPYRDNLKAGLVWNTNGLATCTTDNYTQWHRFMNGEKDGEYLYTGIPDTAVFKDPQITYADPTMTFKATLTRGMTTLTLEAVDSSGNVISNVIGHVDVWDSPTNVVGTLTGFTEGNSYAIRIHEVTDSGSVVYTDMGTLYLGSVQVAAGRNADAGTASNGTFVISRPKTKESTRLPLEVSYTFSGAIRGVHYEAGDGKSVIPAGETSVTVDVWPIWSGADNQTLTMTLTSGLNYLVGTDSAASIAIKGASEDPKLRYVATDGSDANNGLTPITPFLTLDRALVNTAAIDGPTIKVAPGTYTPTNYLDNFELNWSHFEITNNVTIAGTGTKPEEVHFLGVRYVYRDGKLYPENSNINTCHKSRVFFVNNAGAKLKNLMMSNGATSYGSHGNGNSDIGGGGVCLYEQGGTVEDCVISNCTCGGWNTGGGGVHMWTGRILRTKFTHNYGDNNKDNNRSGSHLCQRGGHVENSLFTLGGRGGDEGSNGYGPIHLCNDATLANCTVAGNLGTISAGVVMSGNKCFAYNCAIFNNNLTKDGTGHSGVYILRNGATGAQFVNCAADRDIENGTSCTMRESGGFVNQAVNDYHLAVSSCCRDAGNEEYYVSPIAISPTDLDGIPRLTGLQRGDRIDIGCYEFDTTALAIDFYADQTIGLMDYDEGLVPVAIAFHATKSGGIKDGETTYKWDFDGNGTIDLVTNVLDVTYEYPQIGTYTVKLYATDASGDASAQKDNYISTGPKVVYVDCASAAPQAPYLTRGTAAKEVVDAYPHTLDGTLVLVAPGIYTRATNARLDILKGITIWCEGDAGDTVFTNNFGMWADAPFFQLSHSGSFFANATFAEGYDVSGLGAGIAISAAGGTVSNCVFKHCGSYYNFRNGGAKGGGAAVNGGFLTHCIFDDCYYRFDHAPNSGPNDRRAQGAYVEGNGCIENSLFENMHSDSGIVCINGVNACIRNCTIADCSVTFWCDNEIGAGGLSGPRYRNPASAIEIVKPSYDYSKVDGGTAYNTAIINVSREAFEQYIDPVLIDGELHWTTNVIAATNCANWTYTGNSRGVTVIDQLELLKYCGTDDPEPVSSTSVTISEDDFVDYANGDYTPEVDGALYNTALKLAGWNKIVDLAGKSRVVGRGMDIGCYEQPDGGPVQTNLYVDCTAEAGGDGTQAKPYLTIKDACTNEWAAGVGRKILVRGGPDRTYTFNTYTDSAILSGDEWQLIGCDTNWNPVADYTATNDMATLVIADDYAAQSYTAAGKKTTWNAPIEVQCADCRISGFRCEFGNVSFKQSGKGGTALIHTIADGLTVENCHFRMKDAEGEYGGAGSSGIIASDSTTGNKNFTLRHCYVWLGKFRGSVGVFCYFGDGTRAENNLFENLDTLYGVNTEVYAGTSFAKAKYAGYYIISNIFLNCSGEGGGYYNELLAAGGDYCPYGGEIAYNRAIHNDGKDGHYAFMSHGKSYGGSWVTAAIHHNTIVGYDCAFACADQGYMWTPSIFDNIIVGTGTNLLENATDHWKDGREYNSSFKEGSMFKKNALHAGKFVAGTATEFSWYDLTNLAGTNTTHTLLSVPPFVNTVNPQSEHYYRLKIPQCPWVVDAYTGDDPSLQEFPRFVGAVQPQPGGFAVRIR